LALTLSGNDLLQLVKRWRTPIAGALLFLLVLLLYPFQSTIVPRWRLRVVEESGVSVPGINVTEHWQHYWLEGEGHEERLKTDANGMVEFPERTIRAGLVSRFIKRIARLWNSGAAARTDAYGSIVVWGSRDHEIAVGSYQPGTPPQELILVHRQR
jgi:hypothetical protein